MSPGDGRSRLPRQGAAPETVVATAKQLDSASVAQDADDPWDDFTAGYRLGYWSGYEVGVATAEAEMAEAWMAVVHRIRALAKPDDYMTRVAAAERHVRSLALRQWASRDAWDSAKNAATGMAVAIDRLRGRP